jgi:hypothetical protein
VVLTASAIWRPGTYDITITAEGFNTQKVQAVTIQADRTATQNLRLKAGEVSSTVEVEANAQLDATDTTNGYVLDSATIEKTPLGTGSFTQHAVLSPGVHADLPQTPAPTQAWATRISTPTASASPRTLSL